jgi:hypothetical protein
MLRIAHEFSVIDSCSRWQSTCNEIENWMADISQEFEEEDILWFLGGILGLTYDEEEWMSLGEPSCESSPFLVAIPCLLW